MDVIDVVIETPKGSRNKYLYDEEKKAYRLKKTLPMGMAFPFDFGFIPNTFAEDGDPVDIMVLMDEPVWPGVVVNCRVIGAFEIRQTKEGRLVRNDRLFGVFPESLIYGNIVELSELDDKIIHQVGQFFISYTQLEGKEIEVLGRVDAAGAWRLVEAARK